MLLIEKIGTGAVVWICAIVVYSAFMANSPEKAWMMSFGNAALNIICIWLLIALLKALRLTRVDLHHTRVAFETGREKLSESVKNLQEPAPE